MNLKDHIRTIPDYPKPGIMFRDVTTLLSDARALRASVDALCALFAESGATKVAGIEARGFILGGAVAHCLDAGFIPLRKKGKLPWRTITESYDLEYGTDEMELHEDAFEPGERVILIDDLIATGGTAEAAVKLIRRAQAVPVGLGVVIDLPELNGSRRLAALGVPVSSLVSFEGH
jgi:adenine phosphoribosyltransferase